VQPAHVIASEVRRGELSPVRIVEGCLARLDASEPGVQAWVEVDRDGALRRARELESALRRGDNPGPLAGVPVGVKDIVDVAGLPTRLGAGAFAHYTPERDSTVTSKLRQAGAIVIGKTHTTAFAYLDTAPTRNPWNPEHTPGGSSSGSAAAVAAGVVPLAIGSQTVGSVLRPAAYCGVVGLKPSYGRISYAGTAGLAPSFDHMGLICTCVEDAALALTAVAGYDRFDPNSADAPVDDYVAALADANAPRIGVPRNYYLGTAGDEVEKHIEAVTQHLANAGASVEEVSFPATAPEISEMVQPVMRYEAAQVHERLFEAHGRDYPPNIRSLIEAGKTTSPKDYESAKQSVARLRQSLVSLLSKFDVLMLPVAPGPAPAIATTGPGILCGPASFTGMPSIAVPSGLGQEGLPLAIQFIAAPLSEAGLLATGAWAEKLLDFQARPAVAS
jgi:Asp-tRNA(Asn)/Glu-tRNA(Gln) amidotransferase A subunit family amidase